MVTEAKVKAAQRSAQRYWHLINKLEGVKYIYQYDLAKRYAKARRLYEEWTNQ